MTPKVWFLIANHQQLQTPPTTLSSQSLFCFFHLLLLHHRRSDSLHTQTCSSAPPSPLSPLHSMFLFPSPQRVTLLPTMEKSPSPFRWLQQWLSRLMLNLYCYINDRHCPWMPCTLCFFYIYHPQRPSFLLRVALSLAQADKTATAAHSAHLPSPLNTSSVSLFVSLSAGETSQVLWEHYEDLEAKAGLLCSGVLWTGLPSVPQGLCLSQLTQYYKKISSLWVQAHRFMLCVRNTNVTVTPFLVQRGQKNFFFSHYQHWS